MVCEQCENPTMSATAVREKRQTTLPQDIVEAAGLRIHDQIDWSFKDGEIRGKKLVPEAPKPSRGKLVQDAQTGLLVWTGDVGEDDADAVIRNRAKD